MAGETLPTGSTNTQGLADWAAPYITNYLGKAQSLAETPYEAYKGPLTAGASNLQNKAFQGIANLTFPSNYGQSFSSSGAYQPPQMSMDAYKTQPIGTGPQPGMNGLPDSNGNGYGGAGGGGIGGLTGGIPQQPMQPQQPQGIASQYMNPYLQSVLTPQLEELRRQNEITNMKANAGLTSAGAFGGGRQAIMNAENNRNLMQEMNKTVGQGYATAYDKGMGQFNTEQGQFKDVINLIGNAGAQERGITSEGIAADKAEFEAQRQFPFQQVQYMRDMISGLPTGSVTNTPANLSGTGAFLSALGGGAAAASALGYKNVGELLTALGLNVGQKPPVDE